MKYVGMKSIKFGIPSRTEKINKFSTGKLRYTSPHFSQSENKNEQVFEAIMSEVKLSLAANIGGDKFTLYDDSEDAPLLTLHFFNQFNEWPEERKAHASRFAVLAALSYTAMDDAYDGEKLIADIEAVVKEQGAPGISDIGKDRIFRLVESYIRKELDRKYEVGKFYTANINGEQGRVMFFSQEFADAYSATPPDFETAVKQLSKKHPAVNAALELHSHGLLNTPMMEDKFERDETKKKVAKIIHDSYNSGRD
jgi:hypothetical protein